CSIIVNFIFFSSRRRHTSFSRDWSSDVCSSDLAESHSDNAYAGTTGAEVVPYENNGIEGSNSVVQRDWIRYLEDVAKLNILIVNVDSVADNSLSSALRKQYKAEAKIGRASCRERV